MTTLLRMIDPKALEQILRTVEKPGRYIGGEWNQERKDPGKVRIKVALVFPDVYEIGMSYLGQKILYSVLNSRPDVLAERVFAPWPDFERSLRKADIQLYSLENKIPLNAFDIIGFSLLYELNYSNILTILDLGGVPIKASERDEDSPLVIAGGPAVFNPEPVAGIFDLFLAGDGEEAFPEIVDRAMSLKTGKTDRPALLRELSKIQGTYVPSLYQAVRTDKSSLLVPRPIAGAPVQIQKRIFSSFRTSPLPEKIIVPGVRTIFDRVAVETARGCPENCRFCQATSLYFPFRIKSPDSVIKTMAASLCQTGYEDASLAALSISDYPYLEETIRVLMESLEKRKISLSLPSLRPKGLSPEIVENIVKVRKTGFTLVPEAGTERLRRVINKKLDDKQIRDALTYAFSRGWKLVKLYFMIGLPTETEEDLAGIVNLVRDILDLGQKILKSPPRINLSLSSFIPKPHTPFQWLPMNDEQTLTEKQMFVISGLRRNKSAELKRNPIRVSLLEGVFSRGDRRLGAVLGSAWSKGARFDSWSDHFDFDLWQEAFGEIGVAPDEYRRAIDPKAELPWDHMDTGIKKSHLLQELHSALEGQLSPSCSEKNCVECAGCHLPHFKEEKVSEKISVDPGESPVLGSKTNSLVFYRAFYSKRGPARFLSHIDLIHVLQRAFRRAGIAVAQSQGFRPKMLIAYGPALALGMEGRNEPLDFRAEALFEEKEFILRLNSCLPSGIRFIKMDRIGQDTPSLGRSLREIVYSLDLEDPEIAVPLQAMTERPGLAPDDLMKTVAALVTGYEQRASDIVAFRLDEKTNKLFMTVRILPDKIPRPQDIVLQIFGAKNAVHALTREEFVFDR